jgi:hypothetical protein
MIYRSSLAHDVGPSHTSLAAIEIHPLALTLKRQKEPLLTSLTDMSTTEPAP